MPAPRRTTPTAAPAPESVALVATSMLPPETMAHLLREQRAAILTVLRLPAIKVLPAAACMFEFADTNETMRTFEGIILHAHPRNVFWDQPYGEGPSTAAPDEANGPACQSDDGWRGAPREEFVHLALGRAAQPGELVACNSCRYNAWGSASLVPGKQGKGKACTNQRSVYVLVDGRRAPMELVLSPTSQRALDEYLATLLNHGTPVASVRTIFKQDRQERGRLAWATVTFTRGEALAFDDLNTVLALREEYAAIMHPATKPRLGETPPDAVHGATSGDPGFSNEGAAASGDDLPF